MQARVHVLSQITPIYTIIYTSVRPQSARPPSAHLPTRQPSGPQSRPETTRRMDADARTGESRQTENRPEKGLGGRDGTLHISPPPMTRFYHGCRLGEATGAAHVRPTGPINDMGDQVASLVYLYCGEISVGHRHHRRDLRHRRSRHSHRELLAHEKKEKQQPRSTNTTKHFQFYFIHLLFCHSINIICQLTSFSCTRVPVM